MQINSYKELTVWQKAIDLVVEVYRIVKLLPKEETYALSDQMRRAAVSIPSNIAEGNAGKSKKRICKLSFYRSRFKVRTSNATYYM